MAGVMSIVPSEASRERAACRNPAENDGGGDTVAERFVATVKPTLRGRDPAESTTETRSSGFPTNPRSVSWKFRRPEAPPTIQSLRPSPSELLDPSLDYSSST